MNIELLINSHCAIYMYLYQLSLYFLLDFLCSFIFLNYIYSENRIEKEKNKLC